MKNPLPLSSAPSFRDRKQFFHFLAHVKRVFLNRRNHFRKLPKTVIAGNFNYLYFARRALGNARVITWPNTPPCPLPCKSSQTKPVSDFQGAVFDPKVGHYDLYHGIGALDLQVPFFQYPIGGAADNLEQRRGYRKLAGQTFQPGNFLEIQRGFILVFMAPIGGRAARRFLVGFSGEAFVGNTQH